MRFEVRQQDEKWIVWDTVNDCEMKPCNRVVTHAPVMKPNSVASLATEAGPATFWTLKEAQACADVLNDLDLQGFIPDLF